MSNFLKENWFKIIISLAVLIVSFSFYYLLYLPKVQGVIEEQKKTSNERWLAERKSDNERWLAERKSDCEKAARKFADEIKESSPGAIAFSEPIKTIYNVERKECISEVKAMLSHRAEYEYHLISPEAGTTYANYWYDYAKDEATFLGNWPKYKLLYTQFFGQEPVLGQ